MTLLLDRAADIEAIDDVSGIPSTRSFVMCAIVFQQDGERPLHWAAGAAKANAVALLLQKGASAHAKSKVGADRSSSSVITAHLI